MNNITILEQDKFSFKLAKSLNLSLLSNDNNNCYKFCYCSKNKKLSILNNKNKIIELNYQKRKINNLLFKSLGKIKKNLYILDATAGFGFDSIALLNNGFNKVLSLEQNKVIYFILKKKLNYFLTHKERKQISFKQINAINFLTNSNDSFDVIYLDPMFLNNKKAKPKQHIQLIEKIIQFSNNKQNNQKSNSLVNLFNLAYQKTKKKVIVKTYIIHDNYTALKPNYQIIGRGFKFDVYMK